MIKFRYITIIIIGILILSLILIVAFSGNNKENFTNIDNIYMTAEETINFIRNDSDKYITNMTDYDLIARDSDSPTEYINKIINECYNFTEDHKKRLNVCSIIAKQYFDNGYKWKFALIGDIYEEGFPHTRTDIIFLSPKIVNYDDDALITVLIHESIHIYQRYNKEINNYLKENGYTISRRRDSEPLIRANPDLDEYIYKDRNGNELFYKYKSTMPTGINDIIPAINEHPFEIMAYKISEDYGKLKLSKYKNI